MSDALEHVRYSCGIAGEEVANYVDQLQAKVAELEEEKRLLEDDCGYQMQWKREFREQLEYSQKQLAAEQLNNKLLREALEFLNARIVTMDLGGVVERAISLPASTEALDAYVAEKVKEAGKFDMWKTNPYTKVLETSIEQLTKQRDLVVEALKSCGVNDGLNGPTQYFDEDLVERAIKESEEK